MLVLLVDDDRLERSVLSEFLRERGYRLESVEQAVGVPLASVEGRADVIVYASRQGALEYLASLEGAPDCRPYVIVLADAHGGANPETLRAAGADDVLCRPFVREELEARVEASRVTLERRAFAAHEAADDWSRCLDLRRLCPCRELGPVVIGDLAELVGRPLPIALGWHPELEGPLHGATLPMSLPSLQAEVRISIVVGTSSLGPLCELVLGTARPGPEGVADMLREIANVAAGALKRACLKENVTPTIGLATSEVQAPAFGEYVRSWVATVDGADARLGIVAEVRRKENERVLATQLQEGMVIASDVRNAAGALLVPAGTRLTSTAAERVGRLLGARCVVEVAALAG